MFSAKLAICNGRSALLALVTIPFLAGCAVHTSPTLKDSIGNAAGARQVAILASEGDSGLRLRFRDQLQAAFRARGVTSGEEAKIIGDYAIATLPADMSLATSKPDTPNPSGPQDIILKSESRDSKLLDGCEAVRFRASLVLFDRESGQRIHRAEGESNGCTGDAAPLFELADLLVRDALLSPL